MGEHKFNIVEDFKTMACDKNFMLFTVVFSFMFAIYTCLGGTVDFLMEPYHYSTTDIAICGAGFVVAGMTGAFVIGVLLDRYPKYLLTLRLLVFCCFVVCVPYFWTLPSGKMWMLLINNIFFGFFALPLIPVGSLFCIEISFPINEAMSLGWIIMWSQVVSFGLTYAATAVVKKDPRWEIALFMVLAIIAVVINIFMKEDLKRLKARAAKKESEKSEGSSTKDGMEHGGEF